MNELRKLRAAQRKALLVTLAGVLVTACGILGLLYSGGDGGARDYAAAQDNYVEARRWYLKAAEQGYTAAQFNLGFLYAEGYGGAQDYVEARKWYLKAAEQGHAAAQNNLGLLYQDGQGVAWDYVEARKWYLKAAEQGYAAAQNNLGDLYLTGDEAQKWYLKAAERGHAAAQNNLGALYYNAAGGAEDYTMAYVWHNSAAARGHATASKNRDAVVAKLDAASLAEAQELSKEYLKRYVEPFQETGTEE